MKLPSLIAFVVLTLTTGCTVDLGRRAGGSDPSGGNVTTPDLLEAPDMAEPQTMYDDFPPSPVLEAPAGVGLGFQATQGAATGGPCLSEPAIGSLFPSNWLRPRFKYNAPPGHNAFEIRLRAANQTNELIVYTVSQTWILPKAIWTALSAHTTDMPIQVRIRSGVWNGSTLDDVSIGSAGPITIAPAQAGGSIVYWSSTGAKLRGFSVGEEVVHDVVTPTLAETVCVSCHSSTPDGKYVGFSASQNGGDGVPASIGIRSSDGTGTLPPFLTPAAQALLDRGKQQLPIFTASHWAPGDHIAVSILAMDNQPTSQNSQLIWTDLEATSQDQGVGWGVIARQGDSNNAGMAAFRRDGTALAYHSGPAISSGVGYELGQGDIYTVPYNDGAGGSAGPLDGASDPDFNEFYPAYSPDDEFLVFNRAPTGSGILNNAQAEVYIVASAGGTPTRIAANDAGQCSALTSPGLTNSWPKWSPSVTKIGTTAYYWIIFSSKRADNATPQLFLAPVMVANENNIITFPAVYLWNQPENENNHSPAWDVFDIPIN